MSRGRACPGTCTILVRLRRSAQYSGVRGWFDRERALRAAVENVVDDVKTGALDAAAALPRLRPGAGGAETLFDDLRALRQIIQLDGAIHEAEAKLRVAGAGIRRSRSGPPTSSSSGRTGTLARSPSWRCCARSKATTRGPC
ncbi:hypothetical protein WME89_25945 [Sorangium sp. So ce321]|uniref:hypothetical protein n=1 Tax=Sorangium sp. So ce321 TaxID=3133300 RepID=UPI003F617236